MRKLNRSKRFQGGGLFQPPKLQETGGLGAGIVGGASTMGGLGAAVGGPWGAGVGAVAGGVMGAFQHKAQEEQAQELHQSQLGNWQSNVLGSNYLNQNNMPTFKKGGMMDKLNTLPPNSEVEDQEVLMSPQGETQEMSGPSHEEGGMPVHMDPGTRVYSDELKDDDGKTFADKSSKLSKSLDKYKKILEDPRATKLAKFTANKMIAKTNGQMDQLFSKQEAMKGPKDQPQQGLEQFEDGGKKGEKWEFDLSNRAVGYDNYGQDMLDFDATDLIGDNILGDAGHELPYDPYTWDNPNKSIGATPEEGPIDQGGGVDWGDMMNSAMTYAPAAYNLFQGAFGKTPEIDFDPSQYGGFERVTPRRTNLNPARRSIEARERANQRAIRQMGSDTTGAAYSRMSTGAADSKRAMADVAMQGEGMYNQMDMQAQMSNQQAGIQSRQMGMQGGLAAEEMRQRARGVRGSYLPAAMTQLSDIAQSRKFMRNQYDRDVQRGAAMQGHSSHFGYDEDGNMTFGAQTDPRKVAGKQPGWFRKGGRKK